MPKNFVKRTFDNWIFNYAHRFKFPPYIAQSRKHYFVIGFHGLTKNLKCHITKSGMAEVYVIDNNDVCWDIIIDFDVFEQRSMDGKYYCQLCTIKKYYSSRKELWEGHVFESILSWVNNIEPDHWVCLFGGADKSFMEAKLLRENELPKTDDHLKYCFPVISAV